MLSTTTRFAGGLARSLVAAVVGAAGMVIGAVVGLLAGFVNEHGLLRGALAGAVTGALVSVELASSLLRIWTRDGCPVDARIKRTKRLVLRLVAAGRLLRGFMLPIINAALAGRMDALRHQPLQHSAGRDDPFFEPSCPVIPSRRAAVESLPATTITKESAAAGQQTTCPICLHEFQAGESARRLPACQHLFHMACIDGWLVRKLQCPMCRHAV